MAVEPETADKKTVTRDVSSGRLRPLLKWAGGKRQLLPALRRHYPDDFTRYLEPFVGSGAVFFDLCAAGRIEGRRVRLTDSNADLIGCYRTVRDAPEAVIDALWTLQGEHRRRGTELYYEVRDRRFNPARTALVQDNPARAYSPELAAMFIYLNRTGYNGLFRLNRGGGFNVPAGRYADPQICDADHVRAVARSFANDGVSIDCIPFDEVLASAGTGDFVYCDPPYAPLSRTASFAHYTADGFNASDHARLLMAVVAAAHRGAVVLVSNSSAVGIVAAYEAPIARNAGLRIERIAARRAINSRASLRGGVEELIITNAQSAHRREKLRMTRASLRRRIAAARA